MELNEAKTRALLFNPQLEMAEWKLSDCTQVQFDVSVEGYGPTPWNGFTDFCLYDGSGSVLANGWPNRATQPPLFAVSSMRFLGHYSFAAGVKGKANLVATL